MFNFIQLYKIKEMFYLNAQYIHYPRLTYAYPCLKSVNILCLVIKAEDLRHKPNLIHFLSKTSWIHPQNKALRHLHSMQGSSIFIKGREAGGAQRIFLFHWGGGGGRGPWLVFVFSNYTMRARINYVWNWNFTGVGGTPPPPTHPPRPSLTTLYWT